MLGLEKMSEEEDAGDWAERLFDCVEKADGAVEPGETGQRVSCTGSVEARKEEGC